MFRPESAFGNAIAKGALIVAIGGTAAAGGVMAGCDTIAPPAHQDVSKLSAYDRFVYDYVDNGGYVPETSRCFDDTAYDPRSGRWEGHEVPPVSTVTENNAGQIIVKPVKGRTDQYLTFNLPQPKNKSPLVPADKATQLVLKAYNCRTTYKN